MADTKISALTASTTPLAGTEVLPIVQSGVTKQVSVANLTAGRTVNFAKVITTGDAYFGNTGASLLGERVNVTGNGIAVQDSSVYSVLGLLGSFGGSNFVMGSYSASPVQIRCGNAPSVTVDTSTNVTVNTGNLIQGTAAKGVNFTANTPAAGMTSQLLNWYEEGTWTPVAAGSGGSSGVAYTTQNGRYTRIGRLVQFECGLAWNSGTGSGDLLIGGLPFTSAASATLPSVTIGIIDSIALTANNVATAYVSNNASFMRIQQYPIGGGTSTAVPFDGAGTIYLSGTYSV